MYSDATDAAAAKSDVMRPRLVEDVKSMASNAALDTLGSLLGDHVKSTTMKDTPLQTSQSYLE
jgi:hypothetical protein